MIWDNDQEMMSKEGFKRKPSRLFEDPVSIFTRKVNEYTSAARN